MRNVVPRTEAGPEGVFSGYRDRIFHGGTPLTRWAHRSRRDAVLRLAGPGPYRRAADFGCADGWLLRDLLDRGVVESGLGVDIEPEMLDAARSRSGDLPLRFTSPKELSAAADFDLVCCIETLEHVEDVEEALDDLMALAEPGATLIVSVPVELGPAIVVKQVGRWWANKISGGGYGYERYRLGELGRALVGRLDGLGRQNVYSHKGFDYRVLRASLARRASLVRTTYSPLAGAGPLFASTAYFVLRA